MSLIRRASLSVLATIATVSCASPRVTELDDVSRDAHIELVALLPTVAGVHVESVRVPEAKPRARISWSSRWRTGDAVLFFDDQTLCVRGGNPVGSPLTPLDATLEPDGRAAITRLDFKGAEVVALENGRDLDVLVPWVLVGPAEPRAAHEQEGRRFARALIAADVAFRARVAVVPFEGARVVLLPEGAPDAITNALPLVVRGPRAEPPELNVLLAGPAPPPEGSVDFDGVDVVVTTAGEPAERMAHVPSARSTDPRDVAWRAALTRVVTALERGCTF